MTIEAFYGSDFHVLKKAEQQLLDLVSDYSGLFMNGDDDKPVVYCCSRIKSPESALNKLKLRGHEPSRESAFRHLYDIIGIRVVCAFSDHIYHFSQWLKQQPCITVIREKDYYAYPKANGYRSLHILLQITTGVGKGFKAEVQVRTIANDFWATLEHQLKYKKEIADDELIRKELKGCADSIASVEMSLNTIRDLLRSKSEIN